MLLLYINRDECATRTPCNHEYDIGATKPYGTDYFDYSGAVAHVENTASYSPDSLAHHPMGFGALFLERNLARLCRG